VKLKFTYLKQLAITLLWAVIYTSNLSAQCTFTNVDYDNFEYTTTIPGLVTSTTYHSSPKSYAAHWGARGMYMNFVNNLATNSLVLSRSYAVCPNYNYRIRVWVKEINGGSSTVILRLRDSNNNILTTTTSTYTAASGWNLWTSATVTPTSGTLYFELIFVSGVGNNDFGMDDLYLDICIPPVASQSIGLCANSTAINLYDSLVSPTSQTGIWTGPSALNGGYLGTFTPSSMLAGIYNYTVPNSVTACPDSVGSFNVSVGASPVVDFGNDTSYCVGDTTLLVATNLNSTYLWQNGSTDSTLQVTVPGTYWVIATNNCGASDSDTITIGFTNYPNVNLGNDTTLCDLDTLQLDATNPNSTYVWQNNTTDSIFNITTQGTYWVNVTTHHCTSSDTIVATYNRLPGVDLGNDTTICQGDTIVLNPMNTNATFRWQDQSVNPTFSVGQPGLYWVEVDSNNCLASDSIQVVVQPLPTVSLGNDTALCNGDTLVKSGLNVNGSYLWQDNSTNSSLSITQSGIYWVETAVDLCRQSDTITVTFNPIPEINLGVDTVICFPDTLKLNANYAGSSYLWQDNTTSSNFNVFTQGTYFVKVTRLNCVFSDTIHIIVEPKPDADLGGDTIICVGKTFILNSTAHGASFLWQDGSTNAYNQVLNAGKYWIEVTKGNCFNTDTIQVVHEDKPTINLGNDTIVCEGDSIDLWVNAPLATYLWNTGDTDSLITVNSAGAYWVKATNACGTARSNVNITYSTPPLTDLGQDRKACIGDVITLAADWPNSSYLWSDGSVEPFYNVHEKGIYQVSVTNKCGTTSDTILFEFKDCDCALFIPNAFTPNSDQLDDTFAPVANCELKGYSISIYDRWGVLVFETTDPTISWDGTLNGKFLEPGLFHYIIKFNFKKDGKRKDFQISHGSVLLIR
tara:strand:- start:15598 stop:18330 length:2733 start_codon:yes stop_codon:yes gene_type:complete